MDVAYYNARERLYTKKTPSLGCVNVNDRFTVSESNGNGELTYPVGLITTEEIVLAGGALGYSNMDYYLYTGLSYWASSPFYFNGACAYEETVSSIGGLTERDVSHVYGARPVISLKSTVKITGGDGTKEKPYIVE